MKVLLDECVDIRLAEHIRGHSVSTVAARAWGGISNGELLALAQAEFDVFVTVDRNLAFQQHLPSFSIAVILITAKSNRIADLIPVVPALSASIPRRSGTGRLCRPLTIARAGCDTWVAVRRGRWKTVCARVARQALCAAVQLHR